MLVEHAAALRVIVRSVQARWPFTIDAMAVLPDHWHAVWTLPDTDADFAVRIRLIKARFTRHVGARNVERSAGRACWQPRYWEHAISDERDLAAHLDYVHINPVKHGYVSRPIDWPYSTIHRYVRRGLLPRDWACDAPVGRFGE